MKIVSTDSGYSNAVEAVAIATLVLQSGGIMIYPTDTVYGLGCDAMNSQAVEKVIRAKQSPGEARFIVLVESFERMLSLIKDAPNATLEFIRKIHRAPATFIFRSSAYASTHIVGCEKTIAVRIPRNDFCNRLCAAIDAPVLSTSANIHNKPTAVNRETIPIELEQQCDLFVDAGELPPIPSTVIDTTSGTLRLLREGAFSRTALRDAVGDANIVIE